MTYHGILYLDCLSSSYQNALPVATSGFEISFSEISYLDCLSSYPNALPVATSDFEISFGA